MKVLLITRTMAFGGGAESLVYNLYKKLKIQLGRNNVSLVSFQPSSMFDYENIDIYEHELKDDNNFKILNISVNISPLRKNKFNLKELELFVKEFKPTIIHSHLFLSEIISRSINYPQAKWISHFHDKMIQFENFQINTIFNKRKLLNYYEKKYLFKRYKKNGGNTFITISEDTYNFAKKTCSNHPVFLLQNAIDCSRFYKQEKSENEKYKIVNIGNFSDNKNQSFLIEVVKDLIELGEDIELCLIGYGSNFSKLKQYVVENNLDKNIHLLGAIKNIEDYLSKCDLYVHTAKSEAFGISLVEAMASSLPVICFDTKGVRDIVDDNRNGFLIDEFDRKKFINKILFLKNNSDIYSSFSKNAEEKSKYFDYEEYINKLIKIYQK